MMRDILFRGKKTTNGEWVVGNYNRHPLGSKFDTIEDCENFPYIVYGIVPETVGQYTGLTDKNGKRIFEGDVIRTHYANAPKADFVEQVVFRNGCFCSMYEHDKMKMWAPLADGTKRLPQDKSIHMEWCAVIGNIHDNPELLDAEVKGCCLGCGNSLSADAIDGSHVLVCFNCVGHEGKEMVVADDEVCKNYN